MNKSTTENFQQEQMLTEEQKPMVNTSSPDIGNTNVSGSDVVPKDVFDEVCKTRDKLKEKVKEYYDHISSLEQQRIEMIRLRKKEYFNFIFPTAHFFNSIFSQPHKWHIWFCPTHKPTLSKTKRAIFCPRTYDDNATIKLNLADIKNFKY